MTEQRDEIRSLKEEADAHRESGDLNAARTTYERAVALCREEGDPALLAHTLRHLGDVEREARRLEAAGQCYDETLALYDEAEDVAPGELANALRSAALLAELLKDVPRARSHWEEARLLYTAADVAPGVMECDARLAALAGDLREQLGFSYDEILDAHRLIMDEEEAQALAEAIRKADLSGPVVWMDPSLLALASLSDDAAGRVLAEAPHLAEPVDRIRRDPAALKTILDEREEEEEEEEEG